MKNYDYLHIRLLQTIFFVFLSLASIAQEKSESDVFKAKTITWYGVDFTSVKLLGSFNSFQSVGDNFGDSLKTVYFEKWNQIIADPSKFDLKTIFHVDHVNIHLDSANAFNTQIETEQIYGTDPDATELRLSQIQSVVTPYANANTGIGLLFIVERLDKTQETAVLDLVSFDESTGKVLFAKRLYGSTGASVINIGSSTKNDMITYWLKSFNTILQDLGKTRWEKWKKQSIKAPQKKTESEGTE